VKQSRSLQRRPLGRTALTLPVLGLGTAPIGNLYRPLTDEQALDAVAQALRENIDYFDTAPHYGFGLSERRLGSVLAGHPVTLSSKIGRTLVERTPGTSDPQSSAEIRHGFASAADFTPVFDYRYEAVQRQLAESAQRLGRLPDIVYAHDLGPLTHGAKDESFWQQFRTGGYRALLERKAAGEIQAIGLGVNEIRVCERALAELELDVLLLAGRYTLLEQEALAGLLPECEARGVSVVIGGAFNSGVLATGVQGPGPHYYNYQPAPESVIDRVAALETVCAEFAVPLPAAALQFPTAHPAVVSVIAGCATAAEVSQARVWMDEPIPTAFWAALRSRGLLPEQAPCPVEEG